MEKGISTKQHGWTTRQTLISQIRRAGDGDIHKADMAWDDFYQTYKPFIVAIARKKNLNDYDISELIQKVMLAVHNDGKFPYDKSRGFKFRAWLSKIIYFKISDIFREKYKNKGDVPLARHSEEDENTTDIDIPDDTFSREWAKEWNDLFLRRAMEQLKPEVEPSTYQAFEMLCIQDMDPKDVAEATGMSPNNVYVCKSRCVTRLGRIKKKIEKNL